MARNRAPARSTHGDGRVRSPAAPLVPGFRLGSPLGFGARGPVWSATALPGGQVPPQRACAVSVLPGSGPDRDEHLRRRLTGLVGQRHDSLAEILAVVPLTGGGFAVVSERLDGPTLAVLRASRPALALGEVSALLRPLADALARLHALGLTHGDVSPTNVVLADGRRPVLIDLAGDVAFEAGTAGFIAPERVLGAPAGPGSDVWSLAMTAVWLAAGADRAALQDALAPALTSDLRARCTARGLASLATGLAPGAPVLVPSPSTLAQGSLRARAAIEETRPAATRRARRGSGRHRRGSAASSRTWQWLEGAGLALRRHPGPGGSVRGPAEPARRGPRVPGWLGIVLLVLAAGAGLDVAIGTDPATARLPAAAGRQWPSSPRPTGAGSPAPIEHAGPGPRTEVAEAARDLLESRDSALNRGRAQALAGLSAPGSPAARADAAVVDALASGATDITSLETRISRMRVLEVAETAARVRVVSRQSAHVRTGAGGQVHVPEQPERCADLGLERIDGSWRLSDVSPCPTG
jgi:hypothetical protein